MVTGGAKGIGAGIVDVLAEAGATVVIADCDRDSSEAHAAALAEAGHHAVAVNVDLADEASIIAASATITEGFGAPWLLVNNAALQDREFLLEASASHWDKIHAVNARGAFLMTRGNRKGEWSPLGGADGLWNIASNAVRGGLDQRTGRRHPSKGAVLELSRVSAFELAEHQITVNTVLPGAVITPGAISAKGPLSAGPATRQTPFGFQEPREIGAAVLFFASDAARSITNQVLAVDGGFSIT